MAEATCTNMALARASGYLPGREGLAGAVVDGAGLTLLCQLGEELPTGGQLEDEVDAGGDLHHLVEPHQVRVAAGVHHGDLPQQHL